MTMMVDLTTMAVQQDAVYALAQAGNSLFAARLSGLYRSRDGGRSWQYMFASLVQPLAATAVTTAGGIVFAGVNGAVLRSDDEGENWHTAGLSSPAPHVVALAASPSFNDDGVVLAGTADDGVFVSGDQGMSWTAWNFGLLDLHVFALVFSPNFNRDHTIYAGTESGIFRSQNGGRGWHEMLFPMEAAPVLCLALSPSYGSDGRLYAGTENNGLYISDDCGLNWRPGDTALIQTAVNAIQTLPSDEVLLLLEDRIVISSDGGYSWKHHHTQIPTGKLAMTMVLNPQSPETVMVGFADGTILQLP